MPILVRPVREQLEHDRVIRLLQAKWRRKFNVEINPGDDHAAPIKVGPVTVFPDLVLTTEGERKPHAVVEVETSESVNHLEAMSQWANLARARSEFYLFVPAASVESAKRLSADHQIAFTELWSYMMIGDQMRFTSVSRSAREVDPEKKYAVKKYAEKKDAEKKDADKKAIAARPPKPGVDRAAAAPAPPKHVPAKSVGTRSRPAGRAAAAASSSAPSRRAATRSAARAAASRTLSEKRRPSTSRKVVAKRASATRGTRATTRPAARTTQRSAAASRSRAQKRK